MTVDTGFAVYLGFADGRHPPRVSGCVRTFARLEDAERWAAELLGRAPSAHPGADRFACVRRVGETHDLVVIHQAVPEFALG